MHGCDHGDLLVGRSVPKLELDELRVVSALGRGAKGVVFLARDRAGECFALKAIPRVLIESGDGSGYRRIGFEQRVLSWFRHPLLPALRGVFESNKLIGYAMDYCPGPDLHSLRKSQTEKMFSDDTIRFYAAEMVLALEYLHGLGIIYRDLKPENILIQENGHLMLVDFDLSTKILPVKSPEPPRLATEFSSPNSPKNKKKKKTTKKKGFVPPLHRCCNSGISPDQDLEPPPLPAESNSVRVDSGSPGKANSFVGTEEYVSPEVITGGGHDFAADWWSLGIVLYEMLYGTTPFRGSNRKETFYRILAKEPDLSGETTPLRDLIRDLLVKDPNRRIRVEGIKGHDFFDGVDWDLILRIQRPPFVPPVRPEIGDADGNTGIDVEAFVEGVFEEKINDAKNIKSTQNSDNEENMRSGACIGTTDPNNNFSIF